MRIAELDGPVFGTRLCCSEASKRGSQCGPTDQLDTVAPRSAVAELDTVAVRSAVAGRHTAAVAAVG